MGVTPDRWSLVSRRAGMTYDYSRVARDQFDWKFVPNPHWSADDNAFALDRQIQRVDAEIAKLKKMRSIIDEAWKAAHRISDNYPSITNRIDQAMLDAEAGYKKLQKDRDDM